MTSDLQAAREALAALLNKDAGVRATAVVPQTFTPPIAFVMAGVPYRQRAQAVGRKRIRLAVVCLGGKSTNDATEGLTEEMAEKVAEVIDSSLKFMLDPSAEMDQPRLYPGPSGQQLLGIAVNVICESTRG
jgi:uncharacterized protein (DUF697 family)